MSPLLSFGIALIVALQALGPWLIGPMKVLSFLGSEPFFTFFVPLVYWCIDEALGLRLAFILLGSIGINELGKFALHGPRPYWISTDVHAPSFETGFGVPSGHSQISAGFWGMVAAYLGKGWIWACAIVLVALIGLSRLYLGVHFPHDVVVGWTLGFLTLWAVRKLWDPIASYVKTLSAIAQIGIAFAVSLGMLGAGIALVLLSHGFVTPPNWIANATRDGGPLPAPLSLKITIAAAGTLLGQCIGLCLMARRGGFSATGSIGQRALRLLVGLAGVLVIAFGLKKLLPEGETLLASSFRYLRYVILGLWVTGGAVVSFKILGLASSETETKTAQPRKIANESK